MKTLLLTLALIAALPAHAQAASADANAATPSASTQSSPAQTPQGQIESSIAVADPIFRVHTKALGLERGVEMLQWRKVDLPAPPHYEQAWTAERIDSSGFDAAHRNPNDLPFNGERWWTSDPKLDGHPVSADVLAALDAWAPLKPDLSQLPTNLAVSFQPDGDWLSTSQDPAHPAVGDVRVHWRTIERASAPMGAVLIAGRWELPPKASTAASPVVASSQSTEPAPGGAAQAWLQRMFGEHLTWIAVAGLVLAMLLLFWKRRR